jgi:pyridoxamine 5'-phosphate oxidase
MDQTQLANLRRDYSSKELSKSSVDADPFVQFGIWLDEAIASEIIDANAMTLATVGEHGRPSSRVVLLKGFDSRGFVFFTNYESRKARDLDVNPFASLSFFWPQIERQLMISGLAERTTREESENYFKTRPFESQLGAWASRQSSEISSRAVLEKELREVRSRFGDTVPLPEFWGGYRIVPDRFEFWQGRASRLHDRICYKDVDGEWKVVRLSP